jgi:hypothetical protein
MAFLARKIDIDLRQDLTDSAFVEGLTVERQVERFEEAVLDITQGRYT